MAERITGQILLLNEEGDCDQKVDVSKGNRSLIAGTFGSLIGDMAVEPPKVQGKGNVWLNTTSELVRTSRINPGEEMEISISSDGLGNTKIGKIKCV